MTDVLARLAPPSGAKHSERRVGRGPGSSQGKTCGRGMKGQKARNGGNIGKLHFQGGQTPIQRRLPKRGFRVPFPKSVSVVNLSTLERFAAGSVVDEESLRAARVVQGADMIIKVLGEGQLTHKLTVKAHRFSKSAVAAIEKAGGTVVIIPLVARAETPAA
jgi:large subunit ribosomal protein L15